MQNSMRNKSKEELQTAQLTLKKLAIHMQEFDLLKYLPLPSPPPLPFLIFPFYIPFTPLSRSPSSSNPPLSIHIFLFSLSAFLLLPPFYFFDRTDIPSPALVSFSRISNKIDCSFNSQQFAINFPNAKEVCFARKARSLEFLISKFESL